MLPQIRRHRRKGRRDTAYVVVDGRQVHLGSWDSPEARAAYARLIAELDAGGGKLRPAESEATVAEIAAAYLDHAEGYYRHADGTPTSEAGLVALALRALVELYGDIRANQFTPKMLRVLRETLVARGLVRKSVNGFVGRVRRMFRWATAEGMVSPLVHHGLAAVEGLRRGRSRARESEPVAPVPDAHVDALRPHVSRQVWALVELLRLTGARVGELLPIRAADIDTEGDVWLFRPGHHKTAHRGRERVITFGPRAKEILREFMAERPIGAPLFSPKAAEEERREREHAARTTPMSCGNRPGSNRQRKPQRAPGDAYTSGSLLRAIQSACDVAGVPRWHTHQLRHSRATEVRRRFGIEAARAALGHAALEATEIYAEIDRERSIEIAREMG